MSADSPRRGVHKGAQVISPQPIIDHSIIDSVAEIINDIVPQAYAGTPNSDNKESISWARFEYADVNDPTLYPDYNEGTSTPPLLLVLGYTTVVQVWLIAATGDATEVLSWRQGVVRTLRILPNPKTDDDHADLFEPKRPMVAICDSAGPGPQFCNITFVSLKTGEQAKSIKFKNPVCDVLANRRSVVVTFLEKIAVFDARTLEDVLTVTTCYASPGPNPNPVALGTRWLAYSEKKLLPAKRSSGGCEGEGVQSYTATVLYAAKSLGKGLRGLGETVASSLTGNSVSPIVVNNMGGDVTQPGVITILDLQAAKEEKELDDANIETVIAHFTAHSDAIVAMTFDLSGALLMTADKRGHDFHVFRIQPHPGGPTLAAVHHLYVLHRGDTTAKVQDMVFSSDTRWAAISTVRGTTHVFPVAPYGGPVGVRTHSTPHVVNRLSRFHRSAGLMDDGTRSHSPVSHTELPLSVFPYSNPRLPPYPHPTILHPLAQIRQPSSLNHVNSQVQQSRPQQRQRLHSDDSGTLPLKICACFAPPRAWMYAQRESTTKVVKRAVDSLFIMACHGNMIQYDLEPKPVAGVPKEKVCDDTMIELEVEAKGQWPLLITPNSLETVPPLPTSSPLLCVTALPKDTHDVDSAEDRWLSQVEIVTHAGPHRRLWMGPQFVFKTYNATSGVAVNLAEAEAIEIGATGGSRPARSNPVNMPHAAARSLVPVVIDGSGSSYEQSPRFMEAYGDSIDNENVGIGSGENQLREDLAEAMLETSIAPHRAPGRRSVYDRVGHPVTKVVNPLGTVITVSADEEDVDSSQEFDSASDRPEAPRSVCAEEGPASLGDLEPECQTLREFREICAEMRSASEPAINSVPDGNIREVREHKALCAEIAPIANPGGTAIDFEREEAFRDVPTSLSLCVEQGEIPSSPMTHAKETVWSKGLSKREDNVVQKGELSEAQYVVNCDENSVVLMEQTAHGQRKSECPRKSCEPERSAKKSGKGSSSTESGTGRGSNESKTRTRKYVLKEHEDSVVIEDTSCSDSRSSCSKKKGCGVSEKYSSAEAKPKSAESKSDESVSESGTGRSKGRSKSSAVQESHSRDTKVKSSNVEGKNLEKCVEPISEIEEIEPTAETNADKTLDSTEAESTDTVITEIEQCKSQSSDPPIDDFSSIEYHIVESTCCNKDNAFSNQSDEDIEHIQSSEITQIHQSECLDSEKCMDVTSYTDSSSMLQRKNSKNTISDDDLEYIHTSELADSSDVKGTSNDSKFTDSEKPTECDSTLSAKSSKHVLSSDDDLEHIQHSDVCTFAIEEKATESDEKSTKKSQESTVDQGSKSKGTKKMKDIVVIESDTSAADVTVIVKPLDGWSRKTPEKRASEDTEESVAAKETTTEVSPSPTRKAKGRSSKNAPAAPPKRSQAGAIEIIDIDAMQKAEMEIAADVLSVPECKILSGPLKFGPEGNATRTKKSRKNKKAHAEIAAQIAALSEAASSVEPSKTEAQEAVGPDTQESQALAVEISWSAVVKKKNGSSPESEARRDLDLKPFIHIEEEPEWMEALQWKADADFEKKDARPPLRKNSSTDNENAELEPLVESSSMFRSSVVIDELQEAVTEVDTDRGWPETTSVEVEPSWSSIVKKKTTSTAEVENRKGSNLQVLEETQEKEVSAKETKSSVKNRKRDVTLDPSEDTTTKQDTKLSEDKPDSESAVTESVDECVLLNLSTEPPKELSEEALDDDKNKSDDDKNKLDDDKNKLDDAKVLDLTFPEPEPEKRTDSEQEIVPERSSSSDELNANVAFPSAEVAERGNANGANSAATPNAKKGNRSKKKKRR